MIRSTFEAELKIHPFRTYPYAQIFADHGRAPIFETAFNFINFHVYEELYDVTSLKIIGSTAFELTNLPLMVNAIGRSGELSLNLNFDPDRLSASQIDNIAGYYLSALEVMCAHSNESHHRRTLLAEHEKLQVLYEWNETSVEYPSQSCIHELFEEQVRRKPQAIAVVHEGERVSYRELNERANRLAHHLRELGVKPDTRVAICVERSAEMIVAVLATLKAGGAYVPLDPSYPAERLAYMLADSAPVAVLVHGATRELLPRLGSKVHQLDLTEDSAWSRRSKKNPSKQSIGLTPAHLAYVIYTSGSTGQPKGVMIEHRNAVNFVFWACEEFDTQVLARTLASTSLNFDLAVYECLVPLAAGTTIEIAGDALELLTRRADVTLINTVPSAMEALVRAGAVPGETRSVNLAGEALKRALVDRIFATTDVATVRNLYGPSETTTYSTWVTMTRSEGFISHIGRPIANTQVYILDEYGSRCRWEWRESCISGERAWRADT